MKISEIITESRHRLDEVPLPNDWDAQEFSTAPVSGRGKASTFKSRLQYALERAKKIGTGSSRVAMIIEYEGRDTVLKVAKNRKGLAQNEAEADILNDGYYSKSDLLIPMIDYDTQNDLPTWIHTEKADKISQEQLQKALGCDGICGVQTLIGLAVYQAGANTHGVRWSKNRYDDFMRNLQSRVNSGEIPEEQYEHLMEMKGALAELADATDLADATQSHNWGLYKGRPVLIDVGFTMDVGSSHYGFGNR